MVHMSLEFRTFLLIYVKMKTENVKILSVANSAFFLVNEVIYVFDVNGKNLCSGDTTLRRNKKMNNEMINKLA